MPRALTRLQEFGDELQRPTNAEYAHGFAEKILQTVPDRERTA
jgi:hypothetical protein